MIESRGEPGPALAQLPRQSLHLGPCRHEHRHAPLLPDGPPDEPVIQELHHVLGLHLHLRPERRVEGAGLEHVVAVEIRGVEGWIHRGGKPDEAAAGALPQREAQLQLGRGLMDLVRDERVAGGDEVVLEPAARDPGGDDDHVPGRCLRRRFPLPVHHPVAERFTQDRLRDEPNGQRLPHPGPGDDPERLTPIGPLGELPPVLPLEQGLYRRTQSQLDGFAGGASGGDDDHPATGMPRGAVGSGIGWEVVVAGGVHGRR